MKKKNKTLVLLLAMISVLVSAVPTVPVFASSKIKLSTDTFSKGVYQSLIDQKADSNKDGYLSEKEIAKVTSLVVKNQFSSKGLNLLTNLSYLTIQTYTKQKLKIDASHQLNVFIKKTGKSLSVSGDYVINIDIENEVLEEFDASGCGYLQGVKLQCSKLQAMDISGCKWIESLRADNGKLKSIDLSVNPMLKSIQLDHNKIETLDVSNCLNLEKLSIAQNKLKELDVTSNEKLFYLFAPENQLAKLDLTKSSELFDVSLSNNPLGSIDLSAQVNAVYVNLGECKLKTIDLSKCKKLGCVDLKNNELSVIDCSKNKELFNIQVIGNKNLKKLYIKDKKNVIKKVFTETKVLKIKRLNSTSISVSFKKNPYAQNGYVFTTRPLDCISGIIDKNATYGVIKGIEPNKKVYVVFYTLLDINDTCVYGTEYASECKY